MILFSTKKKKKKSVKLDVTRASEKGEVIKKEALTVKKNDLIERRSDRGKKVMKSIEPPRKTNNQSLPFFFLSEKRHPDVLQMMKGRRRMTHTEKEW